MLKNGGVNSEMVIKDFYHWKEVSAEQHHLNIEFQYDRINLTGQGSPLSIFHGGNNHGINR